MRYIIVLLILCSCDHRFEEKFYPDGVLQTREPLWRTNTAVGRYLAAGIDIPPVIYGEGVLMSRATGFTNVPGGGGRPGLIMLDTETGRTLWTMDDYMYDFEDFFFRDYYLYQKYLVFQNGPRTYCIDLEKGKSHWRKWKRDSVNTPQKAMSGIEHRYFFTGPQTTENFNTYQPYKLYEGNVVTGQREELVVEPQLPQEYLGNTPIPRGATFMRPTVLNGDTVLVVAYQNPTKDAQYNIITSVFGLYNLDKKTWMYKDVLLLEPQSSGVVDWCPVIHEEKIYWNANRDIICNDLKTGKEIWRKKFRQDFLFTPLIVVDDMIIANNEDTYLYGLNKNTGAELWKTKSAGTSSHLIHLDGYVYYAGGGDGLLHAVDVKTGKTEWKLVSPDYKKDSRAVFLGPTSGIPAKNGRKGRVYASTGKHVYCFEAIK